MSCAYFVLEGWGFEGSGEAGRWYFPGRTGRVVEEDVSSCVVSPLSGVVGYPLYFSRCPYFRHTWCAYRFFRSSQFPSRLVLFS